MGVVCGCGHPEGIPGLALPMDFPGLEDLGNFRGFLQRMLGLLLG